MQGSRNAARRRPFEWTPPWLNPQPGFEPELRVPKTPVLPLHHRGTDQYYIASRGRYLELFLQNSEQDSRDWFTSWHGKELAFLISYLEERTLAYEKGSSSKARRSTSSHGPMNRKETLMKLIIAIIQPSKLEAVKESLSHVEVFRLTVTEVQGFGRQKGYTEVYRGTETTVNLLRKIELQIAVNDDFVEPTVEAIIQAGRTGAEGKIGDGKIFILPLDECIRIRTGERGPEAI